MNRARKNNLGGVESLESRRLMAVTPMPSVPTGPAALVAPADFDTVINTSFQTLSSGKVQLLVDGSDFDDVIRVLAVDQNNRGVKMKLEQWSSGQQLSSRTVTFHDQKLDFTNPVSILGKGGNDQIYNDTKARMAASGGRGNDAIYAGFNSIGDIISGNEDDDTIIGGNGTDYLTGADGNDYIRGSENNDSIFGGEDNDFLYGDAGIDTITAGGGDDLVYGGLGNDTVSGEGGKDTIYGDNALRSPEGGKDVLFGGEDDDLLFGEGGNDNVNGGGGNDTLYGDAGADVLQGDTAGFSDGGNDILYGGADSDELRGSGGMDFLYGEDGHDKLWGHDGQDHLYGGAGNDYLNGGFGESLVVGDYLKGGSGKDTFVFDRSTFGFDDIDVFADFRKSDGDKIDEDWHL